MPRNTTAYVSAFQPTRVHVVNLRRRSKVTLAANFKAALPSGVTISSATWYVTNPQSAILGAASLSNSSTQVNVIVTSGWGSTDMQCVATLSDGSVLAQAFSFSVQATPLFEGETLPSPGAYSVST